MRSFVITVLLLLVVPAQGQGAESVLGIRAGLNLASITGDVEDAFLGQNAGLTATVDVALYPTAWLGLRSGIGYAARGARWSYEREDVDGNQSSAVDDTRVHYLDIPLVLGGEGGGVGPHISL